VRNLATIRAAVPGGVRVEPVVKADAYGHGLLPVARALAGAGADGLCVATFDEGAAIRRAGIRLPILVLYPIPPWLAESAARLGLSVTAGDMVLLERTLAAVRLIPGRRRRSLAIQVEVETGLGRGGFPPEAADEAIRAVEATTGAHLAGLWSHLSAPEDPALTTAQESRFAAAAALLGGGRVDLPRHLAATGGLLAGTVDRLEGIRPGLALYGLVPEGLVVPPDLAMTAATLEPVLSLHARPVRVADLPAGSGVGYGPSFTTGRPSRIATLPLGYGDGWSRGSSNRAEALVRGRRVPLVGTVAMDAVMADVTDVPGPPVTVDDEFVLIGSQGDQTIGATDVARTRTTISWEVVTTVSRRVPRVYHAAAGPVGLRTLTDEKDLWLASSSGTAISATLRSTRS
jgi:alanine racemase